jgi:hypothetical protein
LFGVGVDWLLVRDSLQTVIRHDGVSVQLRFCSVRHSAAGERASERTVCDTYSSVRLLTCLIPTFILSLVLRAFAHVSICVIPTSILGLPFNSVAINMTSFCNVSIMITTAIFHTSVFVSSQYLSFIMFLCGHGNVTSNLNRSICLISVSSSLLLGSENVWQI